MKQYLIRFVGTLNRRWESTSGPKILKRYLEIVLGRYLALELYNAKWFWERRLNLYGMDDFRGVGHIGMTDQENKMAYDEASNVLLDLCLQEKIDFSQVQMLDIGCGNGFYAEVFRRNGGRYYVGLDITDTLFDSLYNKFPDFMFIKGDIAFPDCKVPELFDLIIMIDVTEHIVGQKRFAIAMRNIRSFLDKRGVFIVTDVLSEKYKRVSVYEAWRSMSDYQTRFAGWQIGAPLPFRDKYIFSIRR